MRPVARLFAFALCLTFSALPPEAGSAEKKALTIEEAVALGLERHPALQAAAARLEGASARARETAAARLPSFKLSGGYTRLSEVPPFEVSLPFGSLLPPSVPSRFVVSPSYFNQTSLRASVQQPLFTGFRLKSAVEAARLLGRAAEEDLTGDRSEVAFAVRSAYWNLYKAREFKKAAAENVSRIRAHLADVSNFLAAGAATRSDVLQAEARLANAELAALEADDAAALAGTVLASLLGLPLDSDLETATSPESVTDARGSAGAGEDAVSRQVELALARRPERRGLEFRVKSAEAGIRVARSCRLPQVFLAGSYLYMNPNPRLLPNKDEFYGTWDIGVTVAFDVWNWGQTRQQELQARAQVDQSRAALAAVEDRIILEVTQARLGLGQARQRIAAAGRAAAQAEENLRVMTDRFREGVALSADVLDAEVLLLEARTRRVQAQADLALAEARLRKAMGV